MESEMLIALRLSKDGFGTPQQILEMRSDIVLSALEYTAFLGDYEDTMIELNKDQK
jgi:hypothetical protein